MNKKAPMNIAVSLSHSYVPYSSVMLTSLFFNNPVHIELYVLHQDLTENDMSHLQAFESDYNVTFHFLPVKPQFQILQELGVDMQHPESYFYLLLPTLFSNSLDRVLYLDTDMVIHNSISDVYYQSLWQNRLAVCTDETGICKGFLLFSFYENSITASELLDLKNIPDILHLDSVKYNLSARRAYLQLQMTYDVLSENAIIVHFDGPKPWHGDCFHCDTEQLWWDYAKKTPFYEILMENTIRAINMDPTLHTYITNVQLENRQLKTILSQYETILKKVGIPF